MIEIKIRRGKGQAEKGSQETQCAPPTIRQENGLAETRRRPKITHGLHTGKKRLAQAGNFFAGRVLLSP